MASSGLIPVFPLSAVVFPGEEFYLHIFEPRYKQLVNEARIDGTVFGIPYVDKGENQGLGVLVKVKTVFSEYPNGEMDIAVEGVGIFELEEITDPMPDKLYSGAIINRLETEEPVLKDLLTVRPLLMEYLQLKKGEPVKLAANRPYTSYDAATLLNLPVEKKYFFISLPDEHSRIVWLRNELRILMQARKMELQLQENFYLN